MSIPSRNADPARIEASARVFFVTTKTIGGRNLLQSDRNAGLLIDVLRRCVAQKRFSVLDFVIMPNHLHLLISLDGTMTIERAMQLVKGAFSFRLRKEFGYSGEIWQRGFSDARVPTAEAVAKCRRYIAQNPIRAGLVDADGTFPWCFESMRREKLAQGLKPTSKLTLNGTTEVVP